jgi:pimeloyl-ACP methyl ester carboxylesterase
VANAEEEQGPGVTFREGWVEADGFRIRFMEAGDGPPLVHLHGAGGLRITPAHGLLSRVFRVIAFEMPGFGSSAENLRTPDMPAMADTMAKAAVATGLDRFNLMGTSFGGKVALWLAARQPELVHALVLEAPAAIRPEGSAPVSGTPEEIARRLYAHPERMPAAPAMDPAQAEQTLALVRRLRGPGRDAALENRLRNLQTPALIVFGTLDSVIPPEMGRIYKELMPNSHLVFVYDAGHAIAAERPEAYAEVVADFLQRNDAFLIRRTRTVIFP